MEGDRNRLRNGFPDRVSLTRHDGFSTLASGENGNAKTNARCVKPHAFPHESNFGEAQDGIGQASEKDSVLHGPRSRGRLNAPRSVVLWRSWRPG